MRIKKAGAASDANDRWQTEHSLTVTHGGGNGKERKEEECPPLAYDCLDNSIRRRRKERKKLGYITSDCTIEGE